MEALIFSLNAVLPIILLVCVGYFIKRVGLVDNDFCRTLNKVVFRLFLPVMLFLNVYKIESFTAINPLYIVYAIGATLVFFAASIPVIMILIPENSRRGVTVQAIFRSNFAFVGIPLASALFGTEGGIVATLLSAILIPVYNILAVIILTAFSSDSKISLRKILLGIIKNPLILAIAAGLLSLAVRSIFVSSGITFRISDITPLYSTVESLSSVATPLALITLGAQFEFSKVKELRRPLLIGLVIRSVIVPVVSLGIAYALGCFTGAHFAAFIGVFATPTATSTVPMSQELGGDSALAGQFVVWTTILSGFVVFIASIVFKLIGVFP